MTGEFTSNPATTMYVDINSCFATIEQQANPLLRGKSVVVAAYTSANGCILAASVEAKQYGIKTGTRVDVAKQICPGLIVLLPDPEKYRYINERLTTILQSYSDHVQVQSIDEMIVRMDPMSIHSMVAIAKEIKKRIREEIGVWITVSIGIAPNAFLAKTASNLKKPDGLETITETNIEQVLGSLALTDLCGIKTGNATRLITHGITTPLGMYHASSDVLQNAFRSVIGHYWWLWLHGWEAGSVYRELSHVKNKSFSQSCSLASHTYPKDKATMQIVYQLVAKMAGRFRADRFVANGMVAGASFTDRTFWQKHTKTKIPFYATEDIFFFIQSLLESAPNKPIHTVFVGVYDLTASLYTQLTWDETESKKIARTQAIDRIYTRFGQNAITSAITLNASQTIIDRIAFGKHSL
jgi:DNA polymerase-4